MPTGLLTLYSGTGLKSTQLKINTRTVSVECMMERHTMPRVDTLVKSFDVEDKCGFLSPAVFQAERELYTSLVKKCNKRDALYLISP